MAEIPIERKQGKNWIPLIVGVLVVLALLGWWASHNRANGTATRAADTSATVATDSGAGSTGGRAR
jgi:hypothetical protein